MCSNFNVFYQVLYSVFFTASREQHNSCWRNSLVGVVRSCRIQISWFWYSCYINHLIYTYIWYSNYIKIYYRLTELKTKGRCYHTHHRMVEVERDHQRLFCPVLKIKHILGFLMLFQEHKISLLNSLHKLDNIQISSFGNISFCSFPLLPCLSWRITIFICAVWCFILII